MSDFQPAAINPETGDELNYTQTSFSASSVSTGTLTLLNGMQMGTTASTRVGREITGRIVRGSFALYNAGGAYTSARFYVVVDHQPNAAVATWSGASSGIFASSYSNAARNHDNDARFTIIYDSGHVASPGPALPLTLDFVMPVCIRSVYNSSNFGDIRDLASGAVYLAVATNLGSTGGYLNGTVEYLYTPY